MSTTDLKKETIPFTYDPYVVQIPVLDSTSDVPLRYKVSLIYNKSDTAKLESFELFAPQNFVYDYIELSKEEETTTTPIINDDPVVDEEKNYTVYIIVGACAAIIIVVAIVVVLKKKKDNEDNENYESGENNNEVDEESYTEE